MVREVKLEARHLEELRQAGSFSYLSESIGVEAVEALVQNPFSRTLIRVSDEKVMACGGAIQWWPGRMEVWAFLHPDSKSEMLSIHRAVKAYLGRLLCRRIEATVAVSFKPGVKWVAMLGFAFEGRLEKYTMQGEDSLMFSRVVGSKSLRWKVGAKWHKQQR